MSVRGRRGAARAATPRQSVDALAINAATATPPWQRRRPNATCGPSTWCWRQSDTISAPEDCRARGGGGARSHPLRMPALPVEAQGGHRHRLCHFPTAANIHNHGATRGTTSAGGGGGRGARAATQLTPTVDARAINAVLKKKIKRLTWQWRWAREDNCYGGRSVALKLRMVVVVWCAKK